MDRQTEQVNQELDQYLWLFVNKWQDDRDDLLPMAKFQYNNHVHALTFQTPFMLDTGRHPWMGFEPHQTPLCLEWVNKFKQWMEESLSKAKVALVKLKQDMATYYNRWHKLAPTFIPGDKAYLNVSDIHTTRPSKMLAHRCLGPYVI